jgi:UDP-glucose 4-epimerase
MVIPRFISQALANNPLTVFGSGEQTRCFMHVLDVINALLQLVKKEEIYGDVFNIGSSEEITVKNLAETIIRITGSKSEILFVDPKDIYKKGFEDMKRRVPDTTKVRNLIDYKINYNIEDIIKSCLKEKQG